MNANQLAVTAKQAFELVGCKNERQFRNEVKKGIWPKPAITRSRPMRWSVSELQQRLKKESNRATIEDHKHDLDEMLGLI